jgi:hypothetical protein
MGTLKNIESKYEIVINEIDSIDEDENEKESMFPDEDIEKD